MSDAQPFHGLAGPAAANANAILQDAESRFKAAKERLMALIRNTTAAAADPAPLPRWCCG